MVLLSVLELQAPKEGHSLQVLADEKWVDWSSLKATLTGCMTAGLQTELHFYPDQFGWFPNGEGYLAVNIEHMIDDYWWVECQPAITSDSSEWRKDLSKGPAAAVLCIEDSRVCLPYTAADSPRTTSDN